MRRFLARFANLFRGRSAEREMAREIDAHLALLREDFERRGLPPAEAMLAARRAYGGVEQSRELHRDARSFVRVEQFFKDVRYGCANLRRNPGFTILAVAALALGIGVNATIFGIYNAVALKQLPVADASRVARVKRWSQHNIYPYMFTYPEYQYLRNRTRELSSVAAASSAVPVLASVTGGAPEHVRGYAVSGNYFTALGVKARIGRTFLPEEDGALGANPVVVLEYRFWQRKFSGDAKAIGQAIKLNGMAYAIVGVAPPEFTGTDVFPAEAAFWAPLAMIGQLVPGLEPGWREQAPDRDHPGFLQLLARLKDGAPRAQAQAETDLLIRRYLAAYREAFKTTSVTLERTSYFGGTDDVVFQAFAAAVLLIVSLVLVVACANVANMLLARGAARQREIAIRLALGAGRARVVRQLLMESILLALLGGAAGVLLSLWGAKVAWASLTGFVAGFRDLRLELDVSPDAHVLLYGLALSISTGILFGLAPALRFTRPDLYTAIQAEGSLFAAGAGRSRLRAVLLAAQVAVSVLLLMVSGGLMGGVASSFVKAADLGFEPRDTYRVRVAAKGVFDPAGKFLRLRNRLEALPELRRVAIGGAPLQESLPIDIVAGPWKGQASTSFASDGYFETLGIRLLRGRGFTRGETQAGAPVSVISQSAARTLWPGQDPLGKRFSVLAEGMGAVLKFREYEVAGVVNDVRFANITHVDPVHVYVPAGAAARLMGGLLVQVGGNRERALAAVESAVESLDPALLPSLDIVSLEDGMVAAWRGFYRALGVFAGILTLVSVTLAGVGIYGVMAFLVSQRTREIGIRIAMGATSRVVVGTVVRQGLWPVLAGMLTGLGAAMWAVQWIRTSGAAAAFNLFSGGFRNPGLYAGLALMALIAAVASVIPARRAARVDPMVALRHE